MSAPEDRKYTKEHEWAKTEDGGIKVGISDYAQQELGDVVFVDLPEVGMEVSKGETLLSVESVKAVSDVYAPVSGKVTAINNDLESKPELINESAFDNGWMVIIEADNASELDELLASGEYEDFVSEQSK